jgi:hypothetical protein
MRKVLTLGIAAMAVAIVFLFTGCPVEGGDGGVPPSVAYEGKDETTNTTYRLVISGGVKEEAEAGDAYELTITSADGSIKTSRGTVTLVIGDVLSLKPSAGDTFTVTVSGESIGKIEGEIALEGGGTVTGPGGIGQEETDEPEEPPDEPAVTRTVIIQNIDAKYNGKSFFLGLIIPGNEMVAAGIGQISGGSVSVRLKTLTQDNGISETDWTGSGSFAVSWQIYETDIEDAIVFGDFSGGITISGSDTRVDAAEKVTEVLPDDFNKFFLTVEIKVKGNAVPSGYRARVHAFLDAECRIGLIHNGLTELTSGSQTPSVIEYEIRAYYEARRIYFGAILRTDDPSDPGNSTTLKVQPIPGKYLDLEIGAKTYSNPTIDLGIVDIDYTF